MDKFSSPHTEKDHSPGNLRRLAAKNVSGKLEQAWVSFFSPLGGFLHLTHLQDLQDRSSGGTSTDLVLPTETQGGSLLPRVW